MRASAAAVQGTRGAPARARPSPLPGCITAGLTKAARRVRCRRGRRPGQRPGGAGPQAATTRRRLAAKPGPHRPHASPQRVGSSRLGGSPRRPRQELSASPLAAHLATTRSRSRRRKLGHLLGKFGGINAGIGHRLRNGPCRRRRTFLGFLSHDRLQSSQPL
jgi:hypothetical protein